MAADVQLRLRARDGFADVALLARVAAKRVAYVFLLISSPQIQTVLTTATRGLPCLFGHENVMWTKGLSGHSTDEEFELLRF